MAARLSPRLKVLKTLDAHSHRFTNVRRYTQSITVAILYAVPLLGLARYDFWDGRHLYGGPTDNGVYGAAAVFLAVVGFYAATFLINAIAGRVFCGFGCPVAEMSRLGDEAEVAEQTKKGLAKALARVLGVNAIMAFAALLWFVDPHVFLEGSPSAIAKTVGAFVAVTGLFYLHSRYVRWKFCQGYCPIGVYYSAIQTYHRFGIHFNDVDAVCSECDVCASVCPVGLTPRDLTKPIDEMPGLGIEGFPEANHCLTCGDCVRACEQVFVKKPDALIPLSLSRKPDKRKADLAATVLVEPPSAE